MLAVMATLLNAVVMLRISAAALPWWGWLLCAVGCFIVCAIAARIFDAHYSLVTIVIAILSGLAGTLLGIIGLVGLVKWIWAG